MTKGKVKLYIPEIGDDFEFEFDVELFLQSLETVPTHSPLVLGAIEHYLVKMPEYILDWNLEEPDPSSKRIRKFRWWPWPFIYYVQGVRTVRIREEVIRELPVSLLIQMINGMVMYCKTRDRTRWI